MKILNYMGAVIKFIIKLLYNNRNKIYFSFGIWFLFKYEKSTFDALLGLIPTFLINVGSIIKAYLLNADAIQYVIYIVSSSPFILPHVLRIIKNVLKRKGDQLGTQ